jgi:hypothetical protein
VHKPEETLRRAYVRLAIPWSGVALASAVAVTPVRGQSSAVQRLPSGDSIAVIMAGPAVVPDRAPGLLVRFYPYASLSDTTHMRDLAVALWQQLVPRLDSEGISWLVLQATDQTPGPHLGVFTVHNYGFVFERGADSVWRRATTPDSTRAQPNIAGRWRISGLQSTELIYMSLTQQGSHVRGEIVRHRDCFGKDVRVVIELEGTVEAHAVDLWSTTGHIEGEFVNPCRNAEFVRRLEFHGQIDRDGKKITGPVDLAGAHIDTWTLSR